MKYSFIAALQRHPLCVCLLFFLNQILHHGQNQVSDHQMRLFLSLKTFWDQNTFSLSASLSLSLLLLLAAFRPILLQMGLGNTLCPSMENPFWLSSGQSWDQRYSYSIKMWWISIWSWRLPSDALVLNRALPQGAVDLVGRLWSCSIYSNVTLLECSPQLFV